MESEGWEDDTFEERVAASPIHQWASTGKGIDGYLREAGVPVGFHRPFHELVILRGEYPWNAGKAEIAGFGKRAKDIMKNSEVPALEANILKTLFTDLIGQWIDYMLSLQ